MRIVIDTNRIIASLIKDGYSRAVIYNNKFEFFAPEYSIEEIYKYKDEILRKSKMSEKEFDALFSLLFEKIKLIPEERYKAFLDEAKGLIADSKDTAFIALCLALRADGIWSDDKHFFSQTRLNIFMTKDLMNY